MDKCKGCGKAIVWVVTQDNKPMPCDPSEIPVIPDTNGNIVAERADGWVFRGRTCSESYEEEAYEYAMISHFATCPDADRFRRSKK